MRPKNESLRRQKGTLKSSRRLGNRARVFSKKWRKFSDFIIVFVWIKIINNERKVKPKNCYQPIKTKKSFLAFQNITIYHLASGH